MQRDVFEVGVGRHHFGDACAVRVAPEALVLPGVVVVHEPTGLAAGSGDHGDASFVVFGEELGVAGADRVAGGEHDTGGGAEERGRACKLKWLHGGNLVPTRGRGMERATGVEPV